MFLFTLKIAPFTNLTKLPQLKKKFDLLDLKKLAGLDTVCPLIHLIPSIIHSSLTTTHPPGPAHSRPWEKQSRVSGLLLPGWVGE